MTYAIIGLTAAALTLSFVIDRRKTLKALKLATHRFFGILPPLIYVMLSVSLLLSFVPASSISEFLARGNTAFGVAVASLLGSISMLPGFIAFPLGGVLRANGVPFIIIAAFTSTLMMVGILTFPVERKYFGTGVAVLRNLVSLGIALCVALVTGLVYGEIAL